MNRDERARRQRESTLEAFLRTIRQFDATTPICEQTCGKERRSIEHDEIAQRLVEDYVDHDTMTLDVVCGTQFSASCTTVIFLFQDRAEAETGTC